MTTPRVPWTEHEARLTALLDDDPNDTERAFLDDALADVRERIASEAQTHSETSRVVE